mgnify:CR=1 FL=1
MLDVKEYGNIEEIYKVEVVKETNYGRRVDYSRFMNPTARIALKLIPDSLQTQPVFLCVDDTMVSKFGTKFENVSKFFDHAAGQPDQYEV